MDSDEREITDYLRSWPGQYVSAREVGRRAGGKGRSRSDPQWAIPVLARLLEQDIVETDELGHFRLKQQKTEGKKRRRWISPAMRRILEKSGQEFGGVLEIPDDEKELHER